MQYEEPDRVQKVIILTINGLGWVGFCFRVIRGWHASPSGAHFWGIYLAVAFPLLWYSMLRERNSFLTLTGVTLVLLGVLGISF